MKDFDEEMSQRLPERKERKPMKVYRILSKRRARPREIDERITEKISLMLKEK